MSIFRRLRHFPLFRPLPLCFSVAPVVLVLWFAPALSEAALNVLFRLRGALGVPADVVIVAIDDRSLQAIGRWPWPRAVMAEALDKLTAAGARAVGLDVIYAEPSTAEDDRRLAAAIARNGRVILPAQLYEAGPTTGSTTAWLRPLPLFTAGAAALGHAHVAPEVDGVVRGLQLSKADDQAARLWAFGLEVVRIAEQIPPAAIIEAADSLHCGPYRIPVRDEAVAAPPPGVTIIRRHEMLINFAGPGGSFRYVSLADLLADKLPPAALTDKIVLIGAAAESLGDSRVVPFMHYRGGRGEGGQEMPGVEIHANIINTIRGRLSLRALPDWLSFGAALVVIALAALTIHWFDGRRQATLLGLLLLAVLGGSFIAFSRWLIVPPLAPMLTGFLAVIPLLLNRALAASRELDVKLAALVRGQQGFPSAESHGGTEFMRRHAGLDLPRSQAWKLRAVDELTARLVARMSFINRVLASMDEGVLVTDLAGRIVFANQEARQLLGGADELLGAAFVARLVARGTIDEHKLRAALASVAAGGGAQLEFEIPMAEPRSYSLLLSPLNADADAATPIGVVALIADITKRVELDRMKTETLQLVSHELRTPLTSIQGLSDVLLKFPVPAAEARDVLGTIHAEAVRLGETINRYLDLTRLESGAQPLRMTTVSGEQLLAACLRGLASFAAERRIKLTAEVTPPALRLNVDAQLLAQAVNNLLSNAIKYSPPDTAVAVTAALTAAGVTISVRDEGFGIPAEARDRIFEKFYRLERDATSNVVGTGLGLPLVREIVERHGGRITFVSAATGGSTFTIHLPPAIVPASEPRAVASAAPAVGR